MSEQLSVEERLAKLEAIVFSGVRGEAVGGFIENQAIGFIEPRLTEANNRRFVDAILDNVDRAGVARDLTASELAMLHNRQEMGKS